MSQSTLPNYRFEVALSFAGDGKRDKVRTVAEIVRDRLGDGKVFFDEWFEAEIAGHDAQVVLGNVYRKWTRLVVTCVCARYAEKPWTQEEWRAIQSFERQLRDAGDRNIVRMRFLPLRFGDGEVDGIFDTAIVPDVRNRSPEEVAALILERLRLAKMDPPTSDGERKPEVEQEPEITRASPLTDELLASRRSSARYILYIARERVASLFLQVKRETLELPSPENAALLGYREPHTRAADDEARGRAVRHLFTVLEDIQRTARVGDLAAIVHQRGRLDHDWYHVRSVFEADRWNAATDAVRLTAKIGSFTLTLPCSKSNLTGVNKEGAVYVPTSISAALLDAGQGLPLSGLVRLGALNQSTMTFMGSALYLVLEPLNIDLGKA